MNNLISIITPNFNGGHFIHRAYKSICSQTHSNWEWIVVDDFSNDNAIILESLMSEDHRIKLIKLDSNKGAATARNTGLDNATGNYIAFLDMDDFWLPEKLEVSLEFMTREGVNFVYSNYRKYLTTSGEISVPIIAPKKITYADLLKTCSICTSTVVISKGLIGDTRMSPRLRQGQDYVFWLQILARVDGARRCSEKSLTLYSIGHVSLSSNKLKKAIGQWSIYREHLKLGILPSAYYFVNYAYHGYLKYRKF
jgi:teichuronic acid biosynthesis glycosyltransferase TuaG